MASRDPRHERHWHAVLTQWHRPDQTVSAFCPQRHLIKPAFGYCQRKFGFPHVPMWRNASRGEPGLCFDSGANDPSAPCPAIHCRALVARWRANTLVGASASTWTLSTSPEDHRGAFAE
jgi:hypothetical protein